MSRNDDNIEDEDLKSLIWPATPYDRRTTALSQNRSKLISTPGKSATKSPVSITSKINEIQFEPVRKLEEEIKQPK